MSSRRRRAKSGWKSARMHVDVLSLCTIRSGSNACQDLDEEDDEGSALRRNREMIRPAGMKVRKRLGAESFDVGIDSCRVGLQRGLDRARFEQGRTRGSEVLTGCSHPRPHELLEVLVLGHGVSSSCDQVSPSTKPGQESTVSVSSEDSLPFAIRSMCWDHDLGWALDAPRTSIGRLALSSRALRGTSSRPARRTNEEFSSKGI
jgi:hypothetical protein